MKNYSKKPTNNKFPFLKREKLTLIHLTGLISIFLLILLCLCPKTDTMVSGIINILSGITGCVTGSLTTIFVQKANHNVNEDKVNV